MNYKSYILSERIASSRYIASMFVLFLSAVFVYICHTNKVYYENATIISAKTKKMYESGNFHSYVWHIKFEYTGKDGNTYTKEECYPLAIKHVYEKTSIIPGINNDYYDYCFNIAVIFLVISGITAIFSVISSSDYDEAFHLIWFVYVIYFFIMIMVVNIK